MNKSSACDLEGELERGIVGDLIFDDGPELSGFRNSISRCGLKPEHFLDPAARACFEIAMESKSSDRLQLAMDMEAKVGRDAVEDMVMSAAPDLRDAYGRIKRLADIRKKAELVACVKACLHSDASHNELLNALMKGIKECAESQSSANAKVMSLGQFRKRQNPEEELSVLGNGWLPAGRAAMLVSMTGTGKSVLAMQFAYAWAVGREAFGIKADRPLKIGIVQTEDDQSDLRLMQESICRGYVECHGWSQADWAAAEENILLLDPENRTGADFARWLRDAQIENRFDLVIVNPFQGVTGFDISDNARLSEFLREHLASAIEDERHRCSLFIVHHTNKPPTQQANPGYGVDKNSAYVAAGGAELPNWVRAILTLIPEKGKNKAGSFKLVAAKRGGFLPWQPYDDDSEIRYRTIRHSGEKHGDKPFLFWLDGNGEAPPSKTPPSKKNGGFDDDTEHFADELRKTPKTLTEARALAKGMFVNVKRATAAYDLVCKSPEKFGLVCKRAGGSTGKLIGERGKVEKALSERRK